MKTTEETAAAQAISSLDSLSSEQQQAKAKIDEILASDEAFVDIHELFSHYNVLYFRQLLLPRVEVSWSPRLTLCAGICELTRDPDNGNKFTRIRLKLSEPLLQYRPRSDVVNTLLHEAIHAYFFITATWRRGSTDDADADHGPGFLLLADAINEHGGYDITVYHTFHDEVDSFRTHIWQCDGPCTSQPPSFGLVKRAMNRAPGKSDQRWAEHALTCGGTFNKIAEPELSKKQIDKLPGLKRAGLQKSKLDAWFQSTRPIDAAENGSPSHSTSALKRVREAKGEEQPDNAKKTSSIVSCPICDTRLDMTQIEEHLDTNHPV